MLGTLLHEVCNEVGISWPQVQTISSRVFSLVTFGWARGLCNIFTFIGLKVWNIFTYTELEICGTYSLTLD